MEQDSLLHSTFAGQFREDIRVGFNWYRFFNEKWTIDLVNINTRTSLTRCFLPWYIGPDGKELAYDDSHSVPLRLDDVPKSLELFNESRRQDIMEKVNEMKNSQETVKFNVPTYALPGMQHFVMDGNHRLSTLTLLNVPFEVTLWNVRGPLDIDCLLDLHFWLKPSTA